MAARAYALAALVLAMTFRFNGTAHASGPTSSTLLWPDTTTPTLNAFPPLPPADAEFTSQIQALVRAVHLDEHTAADKNPDNVEDWGSICVVDISNPAKPRVGGWEMNNFVYPASTYKMYALGEAIRQVCAKERSLDDLTTVSAINAVDDEHLTAGQVLSLAEVLRLMCTYSDNTAANVTIDTVDRRRISALMRALGCYGSEVTRKYHPRSREVEEYKSVPSTVTSAYHLATFLWAVENGAIGGGRGRGLIKSYLATNVQNSTRFRAGLPASATIYSKTGEWNTFTTEAALVEDGPIRYIMCVMTVQPIKTAAPRIAEFARSVHNLLTGEKSSAK